jgi:hypothetical protein
MRRVGISACGLDETDINQSFTKLHQKLFKMTLKTVGHLSPADTLKVVVCTSPSNIANGSSHSRRKEADRWDGSS